MSDIPDDVPVTELSIPGTHNSGSVDGPLGFAKTQDLDLAEQLDTGIRFLDIRLSHYQDDLLVHHDVVYMGMSYRDILLICHEFLTRNPSETILMSIKEEGRADSALGDFAPSEVIARLSRGETESRQNTRSFDETFADRTWEHVADTSLFYNVEAGPSGSRHEARSAVFTCATTLGDIRGKIVLFRRFEGDSNVGFDMTYWLDDNRTRSDQDESGNTRNAVPPIYAIEDHYSDPDGKYDLVVSHLEEAVTGDPRDLYITFSSAVNLRPYGYAKTINPRLNDYLEQSAPGRIGIVAMDHSEEPPELAANVIRANWGLAERAGRSSEFSTLGD
jgi:1-phosphatidylinositol phosphodiesterase